MRLFLDTSALIKLFVKERASDAVVEAVSESKDLFLSAITHVEVHSALARMTLDKRLDPSGLKKRLVKFEQLWQEAQIVLVTENLLATASKLSLKHKLRGYDAIQLAALREVTLTPKPHFGCYDRALNTAAKAEGFKLLSL